MKNFKKRDIIIAIVCFVFGVCLVGYDAYKSQYWDASIEYNYAWEEQLKEYLTWDYFEFASGLKIPEEFLSNYPDIVKLILWSLTLEKKEDKQKWLDMYYIMNEEQIETLREILNNEKDRLAEIEEKYDEKIEGFVNE